MTPINTFIEHHKLTNETLVLYSCHYDSEKSLTYADSNFYYITGLQIPNLLVIYTNKNIYFIHKNTNIWDDDHSILKPLYELYGKDTIIYNSENLSSIIKYFPKKILTLDNFSQIQLFDKSTHRIINTNYIINIQVLIKIASNSRRIKTKKEITNIVKATQYTTKGFRNMLTEFKKKKLNTSYKVVNNIKCFWGNMNLFTLAYNPICTSGSHNSILHSNQYHYKFKLGELVLLDMACKYNNYCSDITRTFPVSGKFTPEQKKMYDIVLDINTFAIKTVKPGMNWFDLQNKCLLRLYNSLEKINLFTEINRAKNEKIRLAAILMKHSLGHTIGIDVHDVPVDIFKENMVITIEPGIYFDAHLYNNTDINKKELKKYFSIGGIRIEDVVLIGSTGAKNLSTLAKTTNGIEKLMNNI